jgi:hypothetical protein
MIQSTELITCFTEWTEVNMWQKLIPIIARISGRVFIGKELCHDPEYLRCIIQFTSESFQAKGALCKSSSHIS